LLTMCGARDSTKMTSIAKIELPVPGLEELRAEARAEGFNFIETLIDDWESGSNRFNRSGERLCGCFDRDELVAVGGLNLDPFAGGPGTGRIRRVYVRAAWRNQAIGRSLVMHLVEQARTHFDCVRLRAENEHAARLYERLGFIPIENADATHILRFYQDETAS
jgi:GNAT superfamily N-acetyltransferase